MPDPQPLKEPADAKADVNPARTVNFWAAPIVVSLALMAALAAFFLSGLLNPAANLRHFPVAVINDDAGPTGGQMVEKMLAGIDRNKFDVRLLSREDGVHQLSAAQVYGAALIPPNFSTKMQNYAKAAAGAGRVERPMVLVLSNPRAGALGASIAGQSLNHAVSATNRSFGQRLLEDAVAQAEGKELPGAVAALLANPIDVRGEAYNPLPSGTGNGLSAFYYALLVVLAGFVGSIVVGSLVDSMLGYAPAEFGRVYRLAEKVRVSRFRTLLIKWALMAAVAVLTSAAYLAIAKGLGMPINHGALLWLYGVFAIAAVGITATSLIAVLGSAGLLVGMFLFVILGLPSAGAAIPLEATPPVFSWLARFQPMHQVFMGIRALLYFDGQFQAGLSQALLWTAIGLVVGLLLGGIVTRRYDRRGDQENSAESDSAHEPEAEETAKTAQASTATEPDK
ncbi:hypothetical protein [Mycobacterium leprae TN] [Mycobacterium shimoidei]|uniref:ABC-2 type transporter transmembrane domain-containing protein n=1 Tax=Mycobacterium shimoidei TaxID=29313 RepID=A0A375YUQ8_MYCSH|nr:ABC transporter permease [Mycobacterium shimoidei]SRX92663.1 hypothetical protein [Mycobacterium leprae TN] [Mycobacterium shimoidei]